METPDFDAALNESLDVIDRDLAESGVALASRPLRAALDFVRFCILQINTGKGAEPTPSDPSEFTKTEWFRIVFTKTRAWYEGRYAAGMGGRAREFLTGVITIYDTPFLMKAPATTMEPDPDGSSWLCFHEKVEDDEDALAWVVNGPNFAAAPRSDGMRARRHANEIATNLRAISVTLLGISGEDKRVSELRGEIIPYLERAAVQIAQGGFDDFKRSHWDMQMACEIALKLLAQQRSGSFHEAHDLFALYDRMPGGLPSFPRTMLSKLPNWERMAEWRYADGERVSLADTHRRYRSALQIVVGTVADLKRAFVLNQARIKLARPPWLADAGAA